MQALNVQLNALPAEPAKHGTALRRQDAGSAEPSFSSLLASFSPDTAMDGRTSAEPTPAEPTRTNTQNDSPKSGRTDGPERPRDTESSRKPNRKERPLQTEKEAPEADGSEAERTAVPLQDVEALLVPAPDFIPEPELPEPDADAEALAVTEAAAPSPGTDMDLFAPAEEAPVLPEAPVSVQDVPSPAQEKTARVDVPQREASRTERPLPQESLPQEETALSASEEEWLAEDSALLTQEKPVRKEPRYLPEEPPLEEPESLTLQLSPEEFAEILDAPSVRDREIEERPVISVQDLRTETETVTAARQSQSEGSGSFGTGTDSGASPTFVLSLPPLTEQAGSAEQLSQGSFQHLLSQQIERTVPDFVRATNFVLRDGGRGTIDMILRPEQLGNVKVSLQLSDKVIVGQITVASKEAMEAFKENLGALKQAFIQSGFEDASLTLSMADGSAANDSTFAGQQQQAGQRFNSERAYGQYVIGADAEFDMPDVSPSLRADGSRYAIDVVA